MVKSLIIGTALADAVAYARSIIQDPVKKAEYQEKLKANGYKGILKA